jgi:hypothetical protein
VLVVVSLLVLSLSVSIVSCDWWLLPWWWVNVGHWLRSLLVSVVVSFGSVGIMFMFGVYLSIVEDIVGVAG